MAADINNNALLRELRRPCPIEFSPAGRNINWARV
jgi:hypothetical protein